MLRDAMTYGDGSNAHGTAVFTSDVTIRVGLEPLISGREVGP